MKVAIGSKNPVKIEAVKEAFEKVWPEQEFEFVGLDVPSGVADQPMSYQESLKGAHIRAASAKEQANADYGVGLESGIQEIGGRWFDCGWVIVINEKRQEGIGSSIQIEISQKMLTLINDGMEISKAMDRLFNQENTGHNNGHFGTVTNNLITRKRSYVDGTIAALSHFLHPQLFDEDK